MTPQVYYDYFRDVAERLRLLRPQPSDPVRFYALDADQLLMPSREIDLSEMTLCVFHFDESGSRQTRGARSEQSQTYTFAAMESADVDDTPKQIQVYDKSYQVGKAIIAKLMHESDEGCSPFGTFEGYDCNFSDPLFEGAVGVIFSVRFRLITSLTHQRDQWHDL